MHYEEGSETPYLTEEIFIHNVFEPDTGKVDILLYKKSVSANGIDYTLLVKDRTEGYSVYHSFQAHNESEIVKDEPIVITEEEYKTVLNEVYKVYYNIEMLPIQVTDITGVSKKTISMNSNTIMTLEIIFNGKYNGDDSVNSVNFNYNTDKIHNMKNFTKSGMLLREVKYTYPGNLVTSPREIDMSVFNKHMHTWVDATCTTPKTCFTCQAVSGDPLGHSGTEDGICDVCHDGASAVIDGVYFKTIQEAINTAESGKTIILSSDIVLTNGLVIDSKELTLCLNNHNISSDASQPDTALIKVEGAGKLTITGEGVVNSASQSNNFSIAVWARNGGTVIIEGGTFTNLGAKSKNNDEPNNNELIYTSGTGSSILIKNGIFIGNISNETYGARFTLNQHDGARNDSSIVVKGGSYTNFNPSNNLAEGENTNFVATGFVVTSSEVEGKTIYTVSAAQ